MKRDRYDERHRHDEKRYHDSDWYDGRSDRRRRDQGRSRDSSSRSHLPPRPPLRGGPDDDRDIQASSYSEFRRLKRIKLADEERYTIWDRSPSPEPEPLLEKTPDPADNDTAADAGPSTSKQRSDAAATGGATLHPELAALDQEEIKLFMDWLQTKRHAAAEEADRLRVEEEASRLVGPALPSVANVDGVTGGSYGINLRPGEGDRMAAFARSGERIPRRGEIGMSSDQIEKYEKEGYVMSGSRHSRMNAIRMRKENQVYTAEEKAALALFNAEEARRKEEKLISEMKKLVDDAVGENEQAANEEG